MLSALMTREFGRLVARAAEQPAGRTRTEASPEALAAGIELIARGFVLASHGEPQVDPWVELERAIDGYLRP